jgi:hypothetical protein
VGSARYDFHRLENWAMVTPSTTRWSAVQLASITVTGTTSMFLLYRGTVRSAPRAPITTCGTTRIGVQYLIQVHTQVN